MDTHASDQGERQPLLSRDHTMNKIVIEVLNHINPMKRQNLSIKQLEAIRAVMLTAVDDTRRPADLHDALLQQDVQTIHDLDDLSLQFVKELIFDWKSEKTNRSPTETKPVPASQDFATTGLLIQGLDTWESSVSTSTKELGLQPQASVSPNQPLDGVGSLQSKVDKSLPKPNFLGNASAEPPFSGLGLLQSQTFRTPPESGAPADTSADPQVSKQNASKPDVPGNPEQDDTEKPLQDLKQEAPQTPEQSFSHPGVPDIPNQDDCEQPLREQKQEDEKEHERYPLIFKPSKSRIPTPMFTTSKPRIYTPMSTRSKSRIPTHISTRSKSQIPTPISTKSRIPTPISTPSKSRIPTPMFTTSKPRIYTPMSTRSKSRIPTHISTRSKSQIPTPISTKSRIPTPISTKSRMTIPVSTRKISQTTTPISTGKSSQPTAPTPTFTGFLRKKSGISRPRQSGVQASSLEESRKKEPK